MSDLSVRVATAADIVAVDTLLARSYPALLKVDYAPSVMVAALPVITKARPELVTSSTYFVAEVDSQVVGAGGWTAHAPTGGAVPGLGHVRHVQADLNQRSMFKQLQKAQCHKAQQEMSRGQVPSKMPVTKWVRHKQSQEKAHRKSPLG